MGSVKLSKYFFSNLETNGNLHIKLIISNVPVISILAVFRSK